MTTTQSSIPVPTGLKFSQGPSTNSTTPRNIISWNPTEGATSYRIFKSNSRFGKYEQIAETTDTTFIDENLAGRSQFEHIYKIQAVSNGVCSELSEVTSKESDMFGNNFIVFTRQDDPARIHQTTTDVYNKQHDSQFGEGRYVLAYKNGDYSGDKNLIDVGYYTQLLGLGKHPNDVALYNIHCPAALPDNNATCNFWCGIENLTVKDLENNDDAYFDFTWSVSQAAPCRRCNIFRKGHFDWYYGWASGGYISDTRFHKQAGSFSQQQYFYRNCQLDTGVYGINWNEVILGCSGVNKNNSSDNSNKPWSRSVDLKNGNGYTNWDARGCGTVIERTEVIREKPFMFYDAGSDSYKVFIPALRRNITGISWNDSSPGQGAILDVEKSFYVARADRDNADTINEHLAKGKNIILSPGIYRVNKPLHVIKPDTIILGLGMATVLPENEETGIMCEDVGGITIAGVILDAGRHSSSMVLLGKEGCNKDHSANPTVLHDVIFRVGGTGKLGTCDSCLVINSNDVIIDHTWIWRADHGAETGWYTNKSKNGCVVNGNNVLFYGLFCEHFQEYDILFRGDNCKTYFVQNEKCYDPQKQEEWMSHDGSKKGFAAYKVCNNVNRHYAVGLGVYDVFINTGGASIYLDNPVEVPNNGGVLIENICTVEIARADGPKVGFNHIINNTGAGIRTGAGQTGGSGFAVQRILNYNNATAYGLKDYYVDEHGEAKVYEHGENPTNDRYAEKDIRKEASSRDNEKPAWEVTDDDYRLIVQQKNIPVFYHPYSTKCSSFAQVNETMNEMVGKVNSMVIEKINEKQEQLQNENFNAFSQEAKEELNNWTKYVARHTAELTNKIAEKLNSFDDESSSQGVKCVCCGTFPIMGKRFKCICCPNFNFCESCEEKYGEQHEHPLIKYYSPSQK